MNSRKMVIAGGISFIVAALAFVGVFSYLAAKFNYPDVLDGAAADVLPRLREGGPTMRAVWAIYAFLPLLLIPGAVAAFLACQQKRARMTLALIFASLASLAMCLGLMRWPTLHWALAGAYANAGADARMVLDSVFDGMNLYLGNYIGEFLGETLLAEFFVLTGFSMLVEDNFARWLGWGGILFGLSFLVGAFRNVTSSVQVVADVNNALLPLWLIVLGVTLTRAGVEDKDR